MKEVIRQNIRAPYSLHDMAVTAFEIQGGVLTLRLQSGMIKTTPICARVDGHVEFHDVQWDFSYAYLLSFAGNAGHFTGEKQFLLDFLTQYPNPCFTVMDEAYGYNTTKYSGYVTIDGELRECCLEIYHDGDMLFVDEREFGGMREVILSADDEAVLYLVPEEVAEDLNQYCWDFAASWIWNGPENAKFLKPFSDTQIGVVYGAADFIDYLNKWVFPERPSKLVKRLGCYDYEIPDEYENIPRFNF